MFTAPSAPNAAAQVDATAPQVANVQAAAASKAAITADGGAASASLRQAAAALNPRVRVALLYVIEGDLRFLSHHDEMRLIARAVVRAAWPLTYSRGFNPKPLLSIPLPRPLGMSCDCQLAFVELSRVRSAAELYESFERVAPPQFRLLRITCVTDPGKLHALRAVHQVSLQADERAALRLSSPEAPDLKARLVGDALVLDLPALFGGARLAQLLTSLGVAGEVTLHRVRRCEIIWDKPLVGRDSWPAAIERKSVEES